VLFFFFIDLLLLFWSSWTIINEASGQSYEPWPLWHLALLWCTERLLCACALGRLCGSLHLCGALSVCFVLAQEPDGHLEGACLVLAPPLPPWLGKAATLCQQCSYGGVARWCVLQACAGRFSRHLGGANDCLLSARRAVLSAAWCVAGAESCVPMAL